MGGFASITNHKVGFVVRTALRTRNRGRNDEGGEAETNTRCIERRDSQTLNALIQQNAKHAPDEPSKVDQGGVRPGHQELSQHTPNNATHEHKWQMNTQVADENHIDEQDSRLLVAEFGSISQYQLSSLTRGAPQAHAAAGCSHA